MSDIIDNTLTKLSSDITGNLTTHELYDFNIQEWCKNQDAANGQKSIKLSFYSESYLPRLRGHLSATDGNTLYDIYVRYANWFNATGRTVDGLKGLVFRKNPVIEIPEEMDSITDDVNIKGQDLYSFTKEILEQVIIKNRVGILVDFPAIDSEGLTQAEFEELGARPYLSKYYAENILNWRQNRINNKYKTTFVLLREYEYQEGTDEFDNDKIIRLRILDFDEDGYYRQRVYEQEEVVDTGKTSMNTIGWILKDTFLPVINGKRLDYIPFIPLSDKGFTWDIFPSVINDLADINISHYRNSASYENGLLLTGNPTPCFADYRGSNGGGEDEILLGSSIALTFGPSGKWGFLSLDGNGLVELRTAMRDKESQMALLGARIISPEKKAAETAETASIHRQGENSLLADVAGSVSTGMTKAIKIMAKWMNIPEEKIKEIKFELNTDYVPAEISQQKLVALMQLWQQGRLSDVGLFEQLKKGEIVRGDMTFDEYKEELEESDEAPGMIGAVTESTQNTNEMEIENESDDEENIDNNS